MPNVVPEVAVPDADAAASGDSSFGRILVPVRSAGEAFQTLTVAARICASASGLLRVFHVRVYDPPLRGEGRFYPETKAEAAAIADEALPVTSACGVRAVAAVADAPRAEIALAIARQAASWRADLIVMTRRPSSAFLRFLAGSIPDQVMRRSACPVLTVHPKPRADRHAGR